MPVETVARSLSFINWVVVSGLAVGSLAAILLLTHRSESTRGYRGFTVFAAGGWAFLAWLADGALPIPSADAPIQAATAGCIHRSNRGDRVNRNSTRVAGTTMPNRIPQSSDTLPGATTRSSKAKTA